MISVILRLEFIKIAKRYGLYDIYFVFACVLFIQRIEIRVREGSQKVTLAELQHFNHFYLVVGNILNSKKNLTIQPTDGHRQSLRNRP